MNFDIPSFVDRLVEEKDFQNLDPEVLTQIKKDLMDRVENRLNAAILEKMPTEKLEEFEKLLDAGNEKKIRAFCEAHIPNLPEVLANEFLRFRETYLRP